LAPPALPGKPRIDVVGMLLLSGALSVLLLALGWGGTEYAWGSLPILGLIGTGVVLLLLLVLQEFHASDPLLPPRVFKSRSYVGAATVSSLISLVIFLCLFTIPLYFQLARGATAAQAGLYLSPFMLASAAGNVAGSRYAKRFGTMRGEMRIAAFLACAGLVMLAALPLDAPAWLVVVAMVITGPGAGGCLIGSMMTSQNALGARDIGSGTSALLVLRSVGGASGSTLAGSIIAAGMAGRGAAQLAQGGAQAASHFSLVYAVGAVVAAVIFAVTLWMPNARLRDAPHSSMVPE
jgi:hypothetical protein